MKITQQIAYISGQNIKDLPGPDKSLLDLSWLAADSEAFGVFESKEKINK